MRPNRSPIAHAYVGRSPLNLKAQIAQDVDRVTAPTRDVGGGSGPGLGTTRYSAGGWSGTPARHARENYTSTRPAAAPIRTCWPAKVNGCGLLHVGPHARYPAFLAPLRRGLSFVEPIPAPRIALLRNPHFRNH